MFPYLFRLGSVTFGSYLTLLSSAFVLCTMLVVKKGQKLSCPLSPTPVIGVAVFGGSLVGARLFDIFQLHFFEHPIKMFLSREGGLVFFGGVLGGVSGLYIYVRVAKQALFPVMDLCALYLPLGESIARVGCFLSGCCWGRPTNVPWAVTFPFGSHAWQQQVDDGLLPATAQAALPVHPTELYLSGANLFIFIVLFAMYSHLQRPGKTVLLYLLLYGLLRGLIEPYRGDSAYSVFGMTVSQAISLTLFLFAAAMFFARYHRASYTTINPAT